MPSESQPVDNEMPSEILTAETKTPAESQPVNMEMPSESLPAETETPAKSQPVHMEIPSEGMPTESEMPVESHTLPERTYSSSRQHFFPALLEPQRPCCWVKFWKTPQRSRPCLFFVD